MKKALTVAFVTLLTCGVAGTAAAQESSNAAARYRVETAAMYSTLKDVGETSSLSFVADFGKSLMNIGPLQTHAIGEFSVYKFSGDYDPTYVQGAGGLRFGKATSRIRPFGQFLVGVQHSLGSSGVVIQPGGGLNIRTGMKIDARVQVDFPITWWEGERYDQFRFSIGVGIPLGKN